MDMLAPGTGIAVETPNMCDSPPNGRYAAGYEE